MYYFIHDLEKESKIISITIWIKTDNTMDIQSIIFALPIREVSIYITIHNYIITPIGFLKSKGMFPVLTRLCVYFCIYIMLTCFL